MSANTLNNTKTFGMDLKYDNKLKKKGKNELQERRKITSTKPDEDLPSNGISTSKYTKLNFIPKNLLEQFSKMANLYFLVFGMIQMIKDITISDGMPTIYVPLVGIVCITATKDYFEDYKRKKSDREENHSRCTLLKEGIFIGCSWQSLRVGDVVKVNQGDFFPADLLVLNSSQPKGLCFIETKGLDGETNLKQKQCQKDIYHYFLHNKPQEEFNEEIFNKKKIMFGYEQPNELLEKFEGYIQLPGVQDKISIDNRNIVLRGCSLRNTKFIFGLVANTGHDTKIQKNSFKARAKRSRLESIMNAQILLIFMIQLVICAFCGFYYITHIGKNEDDQDYMQYESEEEHMTFFKKFGNWLLIFGNFVPISLLVTLEFVKFFQAIYIYYDEGQYDDTRIANHNGMTYQYKDEKNEIIKFRTVVQSSNLNEELGQIEYIFSDKTGTLTCNIMQFKKISIHGISYGEVDENNNENGKDLITDFSNFPEVTNVNFKDMELINALRDENHPEHKYVLKTMIMLSLTHTIIISEEEDPKNKDKNIQQYNASSPDELALVNFAKFCGVQYMGTDEDDNVIIDVLGKQITIELLHVFEFDSTRKRQSVVIRDPETKKIKLLCKGADSVIMKLADMNSCSKINEVNKHLEEYSLIGLRTLLLAEREIDEQFYDEWVQRYNKASTALVKREEQMQECQKELEIKLIVVGATAIEDQLQDEVGETIAALKQAGIKVWVLTGDKVETARNIGYSCKLLNPHITQHKVQLTRDQALNDEDGKKAVLEQLTKANNDILTINEENLKKNDEVNTNNALIITGDALIHALEDKNAEILINITMYCEAVLCCRVSPLQKQQIVSLVRSFNKQVSTLAIGDGANDVNMITAAHVGIGIKGLEGQQATRASDYAIGEFKLLRRLLFFHGREAYRRNSRLVCYNFWKNIVLVVPQFWFAFYNFFAGQTLYDAYIYQIYNVFYTSMPIMIYAVMDFEFNPQVLTENKVNYYLPGIQHILFNKKVFWQWFFQAFLQAALIMFSSFQSIQNTFINQDGHMLNFWASGTMVFGMTVVIANLKMFIISFDHTIFSVFFNLGSMIMFLLTFIVIDNLEISPAQNLFSICMSAPYYHLGNILGIIASSLCLDFALERWIRASANTQRIVQQQELVNQQKMKLSRSQVLK